MFYVSLLLVLLFQVTTAPQRPTTAPATQPATQPAAVAAPFDEGPLRIQLMAIREERLTVTEPAPMTSGMESNFQMRAHLQGERVRQISRYGNLILTELVDDTGQSLIDEKTYAGVDTSLMRPMTLPPERLATTPLTLGVRTNVAARAARTLKLRGTVRVILADKTEKLTIDNPMQYYGKDVEDARLREYGIVIHVVSHDQLKAPPPTPQSIVLQFKAKPNNIRQVAFSDGTMRPIRTRDSSTVTLADEPCTLYSLEDGAFTDETQLVLDVHPTIEDIQLPFEVQNLELP